MSAEAERVLAELRASERRLLAALEAFPGERFAARPSSGGWSAGQVIEHLIRVQAHVRRGAEASIDRSPSGPPGLFDHLKQMAWRAGLPSLIRVRTSAALDPPESPERADAIERFVRGRREFIGLLETLVDRDLSTRFLRHPVFGALSFWKMMGFVAWHEDRHRRQLARLSAALGDPPAA